MEDEIAHLRSLDLIGLQCRWQSVVGRPAPEHLPKHLLFGVLAYRIQADAFGDLDAATVQLLERAAAVQSLNEVLLLVAAQDQRKQAMVLGTVLTREWNGQHYRVMVVQGGFAFEGKTFDSLSGIAFAITGTNWNGPRFFGLRTGNGKGVRT
ncbi:putative bacteriophage-related protein [Nitrobacter sp. Nb-311A]|uniref:DUF2924 domain-containing protein n=1 Tax=Nitrobacter sp. Nb-311A TaxID=314253 RepID=UPI00006854A1|nr:DUF2924 domain-containing protein [Nitrobacter sp. Nb-311A]EAQ33411.1 putative bacteriophage-related protein [Nitrobacter sp. Nb-311A]